MGLAGVRLPTIDSPSSSFPGARRGSFPASADPWKDRAWLKLHLAQACEAVEWICGEPFKTRPQIYSQSLDDLGPIWRRNDALRIERCGDNAKEDEDESIHERVKMEGIIAIYLSSIHAVCVSRAGMEDSVAAGSRRSLLTEDGLRLVLVHELAHAWDHERHPQVVHPCDHRLGGPARRALVEGHAQHVCARVAERWKLSAVFADLRAHYGGGTAASEEKRRNAYHVSETAFFEYVMGQDFIDAIYYAGGRRAVEKAFADANLSVGHIRRPAGWLRANGYDAGLTSDD